MIKKCGLSFEDLLAKIGLINSLNEEEQATLAQIIDDNNKSLKEYIDSKVSSVDVAKKFAKDIRSRGLR